MLLSFSLQRTFKFFTYEIYIDVYVPIHVVVDVDVPIHVDVDVDVSIHVVVDVPIHVVVEVDVALHPQFHIKGHISRDKQQTSPPSHMITK